MKYFTPELYVRGQSEDPAVLDEVERAWDENCDRYAAHLQRVRPGLPAGLVRLLDFDLHNAEVLSMGRGGDTFVVVLQPDPAVVTLVLTYTLTEEPFIDQNALPPGHRSQAVRWLYDEVESAGADGRSYAHSILLSNGWEVRLRFRDVRVLCVEPLLLSESARRRVAEARRIEALQGTGPAPAGPSAP